ncbi:sugar phosphate isomerase/epimerase family protein [Pelagicoccus mobilis]|uniref:Sugar phosphate isomerase/epimerase n=1 Tax=Pelagicoccus mobilis TaxID=415221 RepID=A0A934RSP2_9BACT|nr:sugar phosphate isomerase/epimerase [Pelagicoccus mobilis]MBK1876865.1 sugar phosphate isomerase/epimerase [Pelagicoccus mobilis]
MTFEEAVEFAAEHDIKYVQFYRKHIDPSDPEEVNLKKLEFLEKHGVKAYTIGVSRTSMDKEENRKLFEVAKLFGMEMIVVEPKDQMIWGNLEELVKEYDIKMVVHNHGTGTTYGNPATVKQILAERDHRIGVCMDIGWVTAAGFDAVSTYKNYGDRVYDMHLKDKRLDVMADNGKPLDTFIGLGNANYAELFEELLEDDWDGVMAIETDSKEFAADPTEFVKAAKVFFDSHVEKKGECCKH